MDHTGSARPPLAGFEGARRTFKFGLLVGLAAIFTDASIAHGLWWENDPYWTYWVTKTFLITTVYTLGAAFLGIGLWQGLVVTGVHTVVLEVYYEWLAPIGLPQEPQWLAFRDLWWPGFLVHYLVILAGYLVALWVWRRNHASAAEAAWPGPGARSAALGALAGSVALLALDGILTQGVLLREFPGITFYVQRLLLTFVLLYGWLAYVGLDARGVVAGAVLFALAWTTYSMYVGPVGLPFEAPHYLTFDDLWLKSFLGGLVACLVGLAATAFLMRPVRRLMGRMPRPRGAFPHREEVA